MIIANLHIKYHAVKAFLVYPGDLYLEIDVEIINLLPETRKGPLLTRPFLLLE
ncbi:MAG: hypothetical protein LWX52_14350 [Deltaproteobacteria bacterium]|jgi:hypothetical protein|nr:hypothetical protein [Deltaproteobacteria bacterium]